MTKSTQIKLFIWWMSLILSYAAREANINVLNSLHSGAK